MRSKTVHSQSAGGEERWADARLETILEHIEAAVACLDRELRLVYANPAFARFGRAPAAAALVGCGLGELADRELVVAVERVRETGQAMRLAVSHRSGEGACWDWGVHPLRDATGLTGLVVSAVPVCSKAAEVIEPGRQEFMSLLAHELRAPLAPLANAVQILRVAREDPASCDEALEIAERQVWQMVRLIDDLLDVTRVTQGRIRLRRELLDLGQLVESAAQAAMSQIEERRQALHVSLPRRSLTVDGDPTRLTQLLSHLLSNAAKFTPVGGEVWLSAAAEASWAAVRVRDTGDGFAPGELLRAFQLVVPRPPTGHQPRGLGVGLALARALAELHGGTLEGASAGPAQGSEFLLRLPLAPPIV